MNARRLNFLVVLACCLWTSAHAQRMYDSSGSAIGRIDGERIYDGSGHQIGRADGLRRMQMIVFFYFFM